MDNIRTNLHGFAIRCITALLCLHINILLLKIHLYGADRENRTPLCAAWKAGDKPLAYPLNLCKQTNLIHLHKSIYLID